MEKITLPGSLPGLLRRGSPVIVVKEVSGFTLNSKKSSGMPIAYPNASLTILATDLKSKKPFHGVEIDADCVAAASLGGATYVLDPSYVQLDLEDPTGRQHAIWWLTKDKNDPYHTFSFYPGMKAFNKDGSDAYKYWSLFCGWQSIRYWDCENDELNEIEPSDLNIVIESLKEVDWENDTEALRRICLHVAKEKGYI